jgi:hypothetical protein
MSKLRGKYWSCSAFADWLRGTEKLYAGTEQEWNDWDATAKLRPLRYWLAEKGLTKLQNFVNWPLDKWYDLRCYCSNRFKTKTHTLTSNLSVGQWHEFDDRILYCLFDEFINFVEIEVAWNYIVWNLQGTEDGVRFKRPSFLARLFSCPRFPEAGMMYMDWASTLTDAEFLPEEKKHEAKPTHQAIVAQEMKVLYAWWKRRPLRPDPYEVSGWYDVVEYKKLFRKEPKSEEYVTKCNLSFKELERIEAEYAQEDGEMLVRLIKIRKGLWT